jgi:hypothetical protein
MIVRLQTVLFASSLYMEIVSIGLVHRTFVSFKGKQYWADGARAMGLQECEVGLCLRRRGPL